MSNNSQGFEVLDVITILSLGLALEQNFRVSTDVLYKQNLEIIERLERLEENVRLNKSKWNLWKNEYRR